MPSGGGGILNLRPLGYESSRPICRSTLQQLTFARRPTRHQPRLGRRLQSVNAPAANATNRISSRWGEGFRRQTLRPVSVVGGDTVPICASIGVGLTIVVTKVRILVTTKGVSCHGHSFPTVGDAS